MKKGTSYDLNTLAFLIGQGGIRENVKYAETRDDLLDKTMSCNKMEAVSWMKYYMQSVIYEGDGQKNLELRCKFLAAYDIYKSLSV